MVPDANRLLPLLLVSLRPTLVYAVGPSHAHSALSRAPASREIDARWWQLPALSSKAKHHARDKEEEEEEEDEDGRDQVASWKRYVRLLARVLFDTVTLFVRLLF